MQRVVRRGRQVARSPTRGRRRSSTGCCGGRAARSRRRSPPPPSAPRSRARPAAAPAGRRCWVCRLGGMLPDPPGSAPLRSTSVLVSRPVIGRDVLSPSLPSSLPACHRRRMPVADRRPAERALFARPRRRRRRLPARHAPLAEAVARAPAAPRRAGMPTCVGPLLVPAAAAADRRSTAAVDAREPLRRRRSSAAPAPTRLDVAAAARRAGRATDGRGRRASSSAGRRTGGPTLGWACPLASRSPRGADQVGRARRHRLPTPPTTARVQAKFRTGADRHVAPGPTRPSWPTFLRAVHRHGPRLQAHRRPAPRRPRHTTTAARSSTASLNVLCAVRCALPTAPRSPSSRPFWPNATRRRSSTMHHPHERRRRQRRARLLHGVRLLRGHRPVGELATLGLDPTETTSMTRQHLARPARRPPLRPGQPALRRLLAPTARAARGSASRIGDQVLDAGAVAAGSTPAWSRAPAVAPSPSLNAFLALRPPGLAGRPRLADRGAHRPGAPRRRRAAPASRSPTVHDAPAVRGRRLRRLLRQRAPRHQRRPDLPPGRRAAARRTGSTCRSATTAAPAPSS